MCWQLARLGLCLQEPESEHFVILWLLVLVLAGVGEGPSRSCKQPGLTTCPPGALNPTRPGFSVVHIRKLRPRAVGRIAQVRERRGGPHAAAAHLQVVTPVSGCPSGFPAPAAPRGCPSAQCPSGSSPSRCSSTQSTSWRRATRPSRRWCR